MNALQVYRLADGAARARLYLDSVRVSREAWDRAHMGRRTDTHATRIRTRRDGSELVRQYHCIRVHS